MKCSFGTLKGIVKLPIIFEKSKGFHNVFLQCPRRYSKSVYKLVTRKPLLNLPRKMKLDSAQFKSCITDEVKLLKDLFTSNGHEIRIVGGAVRDLLMGIMPEDLDFSTTATPTEMKNLFTENKVRLINTNGEKHGTITARIGEKNFEVTTLRIDLTTNGRHAEVAFTKEWVLDANRRDLTINAMYLGLDGTLYDYFNGYEDLKSKRVVFVGDASTRIQEDYLRILRYFRFFGRIAETPDSHDEDVLKAIKENASGLEVISGERIWMELNKILTGRFVEDIMLKIISLEIGHYIGLPRRCNEAEFIKVCDRLKMKDLTVNPITYLIALFYTEDDLNNFYMRVKPSNNVRELGYFILNNRRKKKEESDTLRWYKTLKFSNNHNYVYDLVKYQGEFDIFEELKNFKVPPFPIKGHVLKNLGLNGKDIGEAMSYLKEVWCKNNFNLSAEELIEQLPKKKIKLK